MLNRVIKWIIDFLHAVLEIVFVLFLVFVAVSIQLVLVLWDFLYFLWKKIFGEKSNDRT